MKTNPVRNFGGILPAIASPCDERDIFREDAFAKLAASLSGQGVDGLYVCGSTGDGFRMRLEDRKRAAEIAVAAVRPRRGRVIVQVGATDTRDAIELAEHAAGAGADAVASIRPANVGHGQLKSYYTDIARASNLPLFVYHIPMVTGAASTVDEMLELLDIPGVAGLKSSDWNLYFPQRLLRARPGIVVFHGMDEVLYPGLLYGAHGGIGRWYNVCPRLFVGIHRAVKEGDGARALRLQELFLRFVEPAWQYGMDAVFEMVMQDRRLAAYVWRRPRTRLDPAVRRRLLPVMRRNLAAIDRAVGPARG